MKNKLQVKVCGNTSFENLGEVGKLQPDYIGFIFYPKSKRYVSKPFNVRQPANCTAKRVGVFVNASEEEILDKVDAFDLDIVQLHGDETPEFCAKINAKKPVFKAFQINNKFNFNNLKSYLSGSYNFLFDASSAQYGGSGKKFDWEVLENYNFEKPFILSGGIAPEDVEKIKKIQHPKMVGIDLNSRFEKRPGIKDIKKLATFLKEFQL
jgi:phosphoribosylanthranilate isomerase